MKYILMVLLLAGCTPPNNMNKAKGEFLCKEEGGLYTIHGASEYPIECRSGKRFDVKTLETTIITDPNHMPATAAYPEE